MPVQTIRCKPRLRQLAKNFQMHLKGRMFKATCWRRVWVYHEKWNMPAIKRKSACLLHIISQVCMLHTYRTYNIHTIFRVATLCNRLRVCAAYTWSGSPRFCMVLSHVAKNVFRHSSWCAELSVTPWQKKKKKTQTASGKTNSMKAEILEMRNRKDLVEGEEGDELEVVERLIRRESWARHPHNQRPSN